MLELAKHSVLLCNQLYAEATELIRHKLKGLAHVTTYHLNIIYSVQL